MNKKMIILFALYFSIFISQGLSSATEITQNMSGNVDFKYTKIFEKKLEGETAMTVRAFDLKNTHSKNGIAVAGKKVYIFSPHGTLYFMSRIPVFSEDGCQMRIAKLSKDGYYDNIVVSDRETAIRVFDRVGMQISVLNVPTMNFYVKDLNNDGIDEIITERGEAFYTKDNGLTWNLLWRNLELAYNMDDIKDWGSEGFCCNRYWSNLVFAVLNNGEILFKTELPDKKAGVRCLTVGDFDGNGVKDNIVAPADSGFTYILDRTGKVIRRIPMIIRGENINLNETTQVETGELIQGNTTDEIVISGRRGLVACDAEGNILWDYIKWEGGNRRPLLDNLYISDLNSDGVNEIIIGKGSEILIISNKGILIDKLALTGDLTRWRSDNATVDVADINNDGYQEIIAVTNAGILYLFGIKK